VEIYSLSLHDALPIFIAGVVCCVDRFAGEDKIIGFLQANSKVCSRFLSLFLNKLFTKWIALQLYLKQSSVHQTLAKSGKNLVARSEEHTSELQSRENL